MDADRPGLEVAGEIAGDCIAVRVRLINRVVTSLYDEALRPHGLRISQANILVALAGREGTRPVDLCRGLRIDKSTLSRDVELMRKHGWVESEQATGGRSQSLRVTTEGLALLARVHPAWSKAQREAGRLIGEAGTVALREIALRLGMDQPPA